VRLDFRGIKNGRRSPPASIRTQRKYERLYDRSLRRLNFGNCDETVNGEAWFVRHLAGTLPARPIIFDVGANVGAYTKILLEAIESPIIHCFEPSPAAFEQLEKHLGKAPGVHLHNLGLGAEESTLTLYTDEPGSAMGSLYRRRLDHYGISMYPLEQVQIARLDAFCKEQGIERIDFLKVDAEGHDFSVLQGAGEILDPGQIAAIQFEFGGVNIDSRTYFRDFFYLLTPRYSIHRLLPDGLWPIRRYGERHEVFMYANYVCLPSSD
jgi:FkbM family methyltransferase